MSGSSQHERLLAHDDNSWFPNSGWDIYATAGQTGKKPEKWLAELREEIVRAQLRRAQEAQPPVAAS